MKQKRPVNLDLMTLRFPVTAIASILHRISGIVLFLFSPFLLYAFQYSLTSEPDFEWVHSLLDMMSIKLATVLLLSALVYHCLAGVRHIMMDLGLGESLVMSKISAMTVIFLAILLTLGFGVWIW